MGIYLATYDKSKALLQSNYNLKPGSFQNAILSGIIAEATSSILFVPMEVIKEKLQVSNLRPIECIRNIYSLHGIPGFYRGFLLTMSVYIPYSCAYFTSYEQFKSILKRDTFGYNLIAAFMAAVVAAGISNPMDVVHTRVQVLTTVNTSTVIRNIWKYEGYYGFLKGSVARMLWAGTI